MSAGETERKSFEDKAPEPLSSLTHQESLEGDCRGPQTPTLPPSSYRSTSGSYTNRPRPGQSPFFAGSRAEYRPRGHSSPTSHRSSVIVSLRSIPLLSSPETTVAEAVVAPSLLRQGDSAPQSIPLSSAPPAPQLRATPSTVKSSNLPLSRAPRRVLRPDNWWQRNQNQSSRDPGSAGPPLLPVKSPLRSLKPFLSTPAQTPQASARSPERLESYEARAAWAELTPPPLFFRKTRKPATESATSKTTEITGRPQRTFAPPESQAVLESPSPPTTRLTRELVLRRLLSEESFTEATKPTVAAKVEEELSASVIAHRKKTLEILESSPEVDNPSPDTRRSKPLRQRRRAAGSFLKMDSLHPDSAAAMTAHRREAVRLAEVQQRAVSEKCKRSKQTEPDYAFDELIGKGSFGRVYKGRQLSANKVVAIKVLDIDDADFHAYGDQKDEQIRDFNREIRILRQAQESGAENLNQIIEALPVHSQLWLICEYCPGGSVKTLMRATNDRLSEKYIVVVARELAKALKGLHEAGIMHRDVKAANVLIHQEGRLQLCDFGVAAVLDTSTDKRKTFIGTLHWMPPELWTENPEYSDEVDVWEYGCTLYECAVGRPPNSDLRERQQLKMRMRRLKQSIALPDNETFSDGLRSLVSYTLSPDVASRPSMKDVLQHDLLKDTEESYPTSSLTELVQTYYTWLFSGGQRISLFMPGGAAAASSQDPDADIDPTDEWNFSMTQDFERRVSAILEIPGLSDTSTNEAMEGEETPKGLRQPTGLSPPTEMTAAQKANFEARVMRGADLSNLFDQDKPAYEYKTKTDFIPIPEQRRISDLPFRAMAEDRPSSIASNVIDLGDFDEADYAVAATPRTDDKIQTTYAGTPMREETIRLADASTLREKRANSKGPREPSNQSLTARRASSAEDVPRGTAAQDFATAQEDWTVKNRTKAPELQEPAEITSSRPGHATMDWSFASAMFEAAIPQINEPEGPNNNNIPGPSEEDADLEQKAKKHATMDWSFSSAMAEASASTTADSDKLDSSPPVQHSLHASRPTPTRPTGLMRQMTMPVTIGDFAQAEEQQDLPRPSTALSEAYSDISTSSTDVDPFGLERDDDGDHPGPATMDNDVAMGSYYSGRGRTMLGERPNGPYGYPSSATTTPLTANGPGPGPFPLGRPARIGDDAFPGPSLSSLAASTAAARVSNASMASSATAVPRPTVDVPAASPPSVVAMMAGASNEDVETELTRLLEGMQRTLNAAREVVGGFEKRQMERGVEEEEEEEEEEGKGEEEWVDEE